MKRMALAVMLLLPLTVSGVAQVNDKPDTLPTFDVASVKRNRLPDFTQRANHRLTPGRFTARNVTLRQLSRVAFSTATDAQLIGGPNWFDSTQFDVDATRAGASNEELRLCLRRLLIERFGLVARLETRVLPVYKLVRSRPDAKLSKELTASQCDVRGNDTANAGSLCGRFAFGANALIGYSVTMTALAKVMAEYPDYTSIDRLVVDETTLTETYTFTIRYSPERQIYGLRSAPNPELPIFTSALREQLGLRLQPGTHPSTVVVIERASLPTAD